jgi:hypothetical protein
VHALLEMRFPHNFFTGKLISNSYFQGNKVGTIFFENLWLEKRLPVEICLIKYDTLGSPGKNC